MCRVVCLLAAAFALAAAEPGVKAQFIGGTVHGIKPKADARLDLTGVDALSFRAGKTALQIDYRKVNTLEYGQNVSRRYAAAILISPVLLLSKARRHYVTIGFIDPEGDQQAVVLRIEKGDIRTILASLEARTGRRVEFTDDEARKSGKGRACRSCCSASPRRPATSRTTTCASSSPSGASTS